MATDANKAKKTVYTIDDTMAVVLDLCKSNTDIKETNTTMQESAAALELRVKALELKPGGHAGLFTAPKDLPPLMSLLPLLASQAATDLVAEGGHAGLFTTISPVTTLPDTPQAPPAVLHLADTAEVPHYHNLDFPMYDGKDDSLGWLSRYEQFFWGQRTPVAYKVWLVAYHMTGTTQQWYMQLERNEGIPTWTRFKDRCHLRFDPPVRSNHLGALTCLRMISTVAKYQDKFIALLGHIDSLFATTSVHLHLRDD